MGGTDDGRRNGAGSGGPDEPFLCCICGTGGARDRGREPQSGALMTANELVEAPFVTILSPPDPIIVVQGTSHDVDSLTVPTRRRSRRFRVCALSGP